MTEPAIQVRHLTKRFDDVLAVDDVTFDVPAGAITALLGGNGAGKTTTLSMLLGLLAPTAGAIRILGEDMLRHRFRVLHRMNFSSPYVDLPQRLTVQENLLVYGRLYGVRDLKRHMVRLADELDFAPQLHRWYRDLSAGQKTRVALAKALLNDPDVLVMDEPTASLDPDMAEYVRDYLRRYRARTGATILLASHNMWEVERLCQEAIILKTGRVVDTGAPEALVARYGRRTMEEVFLDIARHGARGEAGREGESGEPGGGGAREVAR